MSYIDFNNLYEQLGSKYAEVQKAVTRWRTSSETVQAGEYEFTITTLPASEDFWSSSKVLISSKPLQKSTMQTALVASNRNEVQKLLQDPVQVKDILKLFALIHSADCSTLRGQQEILGALNALKWTAYEDPTTPEIFRKVLKKQAISVLLPNIELLESTFELMNSIDPLKLKEADKEVIQTLRKTFDIPEIPSLLKEIILLKVVDIGKAINRRTIECQYGIPPSLTDKVRGKGAYVVEYPYTIASLEEKIQQDTQRNRALQSSRKEIIQRFIQQDTNSSELLETVQTYGEQIIEPLIKQRSTYPGGNEQSLIVTLQNFGRIVANVLHSELRNYKEDSSSLEVDLQAYEKKMRAFVDHLLVLGKSDHDVCRKGNFLYCVLPRIENYLADDSTFDTLIICDLGLCDSLAEKSIEDVNKKLRHLRQKLEKCYLQKDLQQIEDCYKDIRTELEKRLAFREQILLAGSIANIFGFVDGNDNFNLQLTPPIQQCAGLKNMFKTIDKDLSKYETALDETKTRLLDANKAAPQPQDSAAFSSANVVQ